MTKAAAAANSNSPTDQSSGAPFMTQLYRGMSGGNCCQPQNYLSRISSQTSNVNPSPPILPRQPQQTNPLPPQNQKHIQPLQPTKLEIAPTSVANLGALSVLAFSLLTRNPFISKIIPATKTESAT
jgi:hypothetical protein